MNISHMYYKAPLSGLGRSTRNSSSIFNLRWLHPSSSTESLPNSGVAGALVAPGGLRHIAKQEYGDPNLEVSILHRKEAINKHNFINLFFQFVLKFYKNHLLTL